MCRTFSGEAVVLETRYLAVPRPTDVPPLPNSARSRSPCSACAFTPLGIEKSKSSYFPFLSLLLSGGHTQLLVAKDYNKYEIIGETLDDALGEAFDKTAKSLDYGYPGGPIIEKLASEEKSSNL